MTTFSVFQYKSTGVAGSDPASATVSGNAVGNLWLAMCHERSGTGHTAATVSDANGGTWSKLSGAAVDNLLGNSSARYSVSVWSHVLVSADTVNTIVSFDDGTTNKKRIHVAEIAPSASYDWTFNEAVSVGSGTADLDATSTGNTTSISGSDLFVAAFAGTRNSTDEPTITSFDNRTDGHSESLAGNNQLGGFFAIEAAGQAGAVFADVINTNGTGNEGAGGIIVFQDGADGNTTAVADGAGTGASSIVGASTAASDGAGAGTGASAIVGGSTAAATASGAGTGASSVIGAATSAADATGAGIGASSIVGASTAASAGAGTGTGAGAIVGSSTAASTATGAGVGGSSIVGSTGGNTEAVASGAGVGASVIAGASVARATATGAGTGASSIVGGSTARSPASGAGTGASTITGTAVKSAVATGAGTGGSSIIGASVAAALAAATGTGAASVVGSVLAAAVLAATGTGASSIISSASGAVGRSSTAANSRNTVSGASGRNDATGANGRNEVAA